jgi:hypothetical protein
MTTVLFVLLLVTAGLVAAQTSAGYKLEEHVLNAGGHPGEGAFLTSTGYRMTLDALGETVVGQGLSSASYRMSGGFGGGYPPPGEVLNLRFIDAQTLVWDPERSVGVYNLYSGTASSLPGLGYGLCEQPDLAGETATVPGGPPVSEIHFYLATAENRLGEEGTKGDDGSGAERPNPNACP